MVKLRCHWDADGITSGHLASLAIPNSEIEIGIYEHGFGDTRGLTKEDFILDMKPKDTNWDGTCIDHHFPHPDDRKYKLIPDIPSKYSEYANAIVPASLITWELYKDSIPKEEWWKVAIGLCGDGQPELIPPTIFKMCPSLMKNVSTSIYQSYGNWKVSFMPVYKTLSSCLNAFLRKGEYEQAIGLMKYSANPLDIYANEDVQIAKKEVRDEFILAMKDADIHEYSNLAVVSFYSKYRMSGYIASSIQSDLNHKTILAINKRDGSVSLRGDLATYYRDLLSLIPYLELDGHSAYMGGKLKKGYQTLILDLNNIL